MLARAKTIESENARNVVLKTLTGVEAYNTSPLTLHRILADPPQVAGNLRAWIAKFDPETRDVIEKFDFDAQIGRLDRAKLLYLVLSKVTEVDLHPDKVSNVEMGYIYEELLRKFSELSNETAGEHFTPREVIRLMVDLLFIEDDDILRTPGIVRTMLDPACGTGGMLSVSQEYVADHNPDGQLIAFGQELNAETYAVCRADMMLKNQPGANIHFGNSFSEDAFPGERYDYLLANPPFGVEWKKVAGRRRGRAREARLRRPLRRRHAADQRRLVPVPAAHDQQAQAARKRAAAASRSSSTARRSSPAQLVRARARSAAGSSRTTGSKASSPCRTSSSTTPASAPTSGS